MMSPRQGIGERQSLRLSQGANRLALWWLGLPLLLSLSVAQAKGSDEAQRGETAEVRGIREYRAKQFEAALASFEEAWRQRHDGRLRCWEAKVLIRLCRGGEALAAQRECRAHFEQQEPQLLTPERRQSLEMDDRRIELLLANAYADCLSLGGTTSAPLSSPARAAADKHDGPAGPGPSTPAPARGDAPAAHTATDMPRAGRSQDAASRPDQEKEKPTGGYKPETGDAARLTSSPGSLSGTGAVGAAARRSGWAVGLSLTAAAGVAAAVLGGVALREQASQLQHGPETFAQQMREAAGLRSLALATDVCLGATGLGLLLTLSIVPTLGRGPAAVHSQVLAPGRAASDFQANSQR